MDPLTLSFITLTTLAAAGQAYVAVEATFEAPRAGADGAIAVVLKPTEPKIVVNENPAPRLKLDAAQTVLVDKQPPKASGGPPADPAQAQYLDPKVPVRFAVALAPAAPKGTHHVKATVTYFYCSKAEGWCRKGTTDVDVEVNVP